MDLLKSKKMLATLATCAATTMAAHAVMPADFSGAYAGINAGYSWGKSDVSFIPTNPFASYFTNSGGDNLPQLRQTNSMNLNLHNFTGGVQLGYNYQNYNIVYGSVIDWNYLSESGSKSLTTAYDLSAPPSSFTVRNKVSTDWLTTFRPILGIVSDHMMLYATGGLALLNFKVFSSFTDDYVGAGIPSKAIAESRHSQAKCGGVIGTGLNYALSDHLFMKAEYLYVSVSDISSRVPLRLNPALVARSAIINTTTFKNEANFRTNIFRIGLNYKFG
jgi:outer membrane immunogenic protein